MVIAKRNQFIKIALIAIIFSVLGALIGYLIGYVFFNEIGIKNIYSPLIVLSNQIFITDEKANIYRLK